jgi:hypothetical protein
MLCVLVRSFSASGLYIGGNGRGLTAFYLICLHPSHGVFGPAADGQRQATGAIPSGDGIGEAIFAEAPNINQDKETANETDRN